MVTYRSEEPLVVTGPFGMSEEFAMRPFLDYFSIVCGVFEIDVAAVDFEIDI